MGNWFGYGKRGFDISGHKERAHDISGDPALQDVKDETLKTFIGKIANEEVINQLKDVTEASLYQVRRPSEPIANPPTSSMHLRVIITVDENNVIANPPFVY
uniref:Uncharacterized protein n=1 Tax=Clandestinovirus TaxID=2831644 RepID=A0A8F8PRA4_9VIRU|nr:hypothetical protein KOM_12_611 [Clandestinovirus]